MPDYGINIEKLFRESESGNCKTEIWAEITDRETCKAISRRIWWEDDEGAYHDETPDLPVELRGDVDNAWIEKSKKW